MHLNEDCGRGFASPKRGQEAVGQAHAITLDAQGMLGTFQKEAPKIMVRAGQKTLSVDQLPQEYSGFRLSALDLQLTHVQRTAQAMSVRSP